MLKVSYSRASKPTALKLAEIGDVQLVRRSAPEVDVNWGRRVANAKLNPNINNSVNKRVMRELFKEHGVPMPPLVQEQLVRDSVNGHTSYNPYMFIGRPDRHSKGRGLWKIRSRLDLDKALRGTRRKRAATHFMEYVEHDREYRVHIFKGMSIRISEKVFNDETKKEYTTGKPGDIRLRNVREAAKLAVSAIGLDFGAVDILAKGPNNEEVYVTEVNAAPGLGGSMPQLYIDAFNQWKEEQEE